jgi:hypothetical protein
LGLSLQTLADEAVDAKLREQVQLIEQKFKPQWAIQNNEDVYEMPAAEMKAMTNTLDNLCKQNMVKRIQSDPSLDNLKFPLAFVAKIPRGSTSRDVTGGNEKYTELSRKTEYDNITAIVKLTDCQTTCDRKQLKISGQVHNVTGKCISKPSAVLDGDAKIVHLKDVFEFVGISNWKP